MKKISAQTFHKLSFFCIAILCGLLPFLFLPNGLSPVTAVKGIILFSGTFLGVAFWLIAQFLGGSISFPRHRVLLGLGVWTTLTLLAAFFQKMLSYHSGDEDLQSIPLVRHLSFPCLLFLSQSIPVNNAALSNSF